MGDGKMDGNSTGSENFINELVDLIEPENDIQNIIRIIEKDDRV